MRYGKQIGAGVAKWREFRDRLSGAGRKPGSGADEQLVIIDHEAFRSLWDSALDDEGVRIERRRADDVHPEPVVVAVEAERLDFDIEIPQLPRVLHRSSDALRTVTPNDVPARRLVLADELHSDTVDYTGRDLRTHELVEQSEYPLPVADQPEPVIAWFANELTRLTQVVGQFAVPAPLVKGYIERRTFGGPVDIADPHVLQTLREPGHRATILQVLADVVNDRTLSAAIGETPVKPVLLSRTCPFLWSHRTVVVEKSVCSRQPCDSGLEIDFCGFLDRCPDVAAFTKLAPAVRFSLEYRGEGGRLAYYYPDFVVRLAGGACVLAETKGLVDPTVPLKDERAVRWAADASSVSGTDWSYLRVDQEPFERHAGSLTSFEQLVDLVYATRRDEYLRDRRQPRPREREEILDAMARVRRRMADVTGVDEELSRLRDHDPRLMPTWSTPTCSCAGTSTRSASSTPGRSGTVPRRTSTPSSGPAISRSGGTCASSTPS